MTTSALLARRSSTLRADSCLRSSTIERLLRFTARKKAPMSGLRLGPGCRGVSPSGGSTLMTSAPRSPSCWAAHGPSTTVVQSMTRTPWSGPLMPIASRRSEDAGRAGHGHRRRRGTVRWRHESLIALQHGHHALGEHAHVELGVLVRHAAVAELAHQVIHPGEPVQLGDLLDAVVGRADHLDLDVEVGGLLPEALVLHLGVRLGHAAVELVALHGGQVAVGEVVVGVDGVPLAGEILPRALDGLLAALG